MHLRMAPEALARGLIAALLAGAILNGGRRDADVRDVRTLVVTGELPDGRRITRQLELAAAPDSP